MIAFCIKQKNYFFKKKKSYFLRLLFAFTKIFVFNDGEITDNRLEDINPQWYCIV